MGCFQSTKRAEKGKTKRKSKPNTPSSSGTKNSSPRNLKNRRPDNKSNRKPPSPEKLDIKVLNTGNTEMEYNARVFTFDQMKDATVDFKTNLILGEGGFGKVYKGSLRDTGRLVAIKRLNQAGMQGRKEFSAELSTLCRVHHPNLVKLIGYCFEEGERLLVYEYMPFGSLDHHLHGSPETRQRLDWNIRMKIVVGAARGLEYLHDMMDMRTIHRDMKCSNILLEIEYEPKLCDFGLAKEGPTKDKTHVSTRIVGTPGYVAPEYASTGHLTFETDIYSFGVVLLEIITGRKAFDNTRPGDERNLGTWALNFLKDGGKNAYLQMADPTLQGQFPKRGLHQAVAIAAQCVQEEPNRRPAISDIVTAFHYLERQKYEPQVQSVHSLQGASTSSSAPQAQSVQGSQGASTSALQAQSAQGSRGAATLSFAPQAQSAQGSQGSATSSSSPQDQSVPGSQEAATSSSTQAQSTQGSQESATSLSDQAQFVQVSATSSSAQVQYAQESQGSATSSSVFRNQSTQGSQEADTSSSAQAQSPQGSQGTATSFVPQAQSDQGTQEAATSPSATQAPSAEGLQVTRGHAIASF